MCFFVKLHIYAYGFSLVGLDNFLQNIFLLSPQYNSLIIWQRCIRSFFFALLFFGGQPIMSWFGCLCCCCHCCCCFSAGQISHGWSGPDAFRIKNSWIQDFVTQIGGAVRRVIVVKAECQERVKWTCSCFSVCLTVQTRLLLGGDQAGLEHGLLLLLIWATCFLMSRCESGGRGFGLIQTQKLHHFKSTGAATRLAINCKTWCQI